LDVHRRRGRLTADLWYAQQAVLLGVPWIADAASGRATNLLAGLKLDLLASLRGLRRQPVLVAVSVLSLSFGTGLVSATATLVNGAWYAPLPWAAAERMVDLADTHPTRIPAGHTPGTSLRAWEQWRAELPSGLFERMEASRRDWLPIRIGGGTASTLRAERISGGYAELFGFRPRIGRLVSPTDVRPGAEPVVVLSERLWQTVYGESLDALGSTIEVDGRPHVVIGVLREDVRAVFDAEVLLPLPAASPEDDFASRGVQVVGVLADGVSVEAAQQAVAALASAMYAGAEELDGSWSASVTPLRTILARRGVPATGALALVLLCSIVLLVAALNLASLLLARTTNRTRELGVRAAIGAGKARIARTALMDGLILASAGGALGLFVVALARDAAVARFAAEIPSWASFPVDLRVLAATVVGTTATALLVSLLPIVRALAIGKAAGVAQSATGHGRRSTSRAQNTLLGGQIVLALVLVTASTGAWANFSHASNFDRLGYRWEGLTAAVIEVPSEGTDPTADAAERLGAASTRHPRIDGAAVTRLLPLVSADRRDEGTTVRASGTSEPIGGPVVPMSSRAVDAGYFALTAIDIVAGRGIDATDTRGSEPATVVSEDAVELLWPGRPTESVLGETVEFARGEVRASFTVVGVAAAVIDDPTAGRGRSDPRLYPSILQTPEAVYGEGQPILELRVATSGVPLTHDEWRAWVPGVMPGAGVARTFELEQVLRQWIQPMFVVGALLAGLALLVLALVAIGIYGTVSYRIASTRQEIGVRLALGADTTQVVRSVLAPLVRVLTVAVTVGVGLAIATIPVLAAGGFQVKASGGATLLIVSVVIVGATALASLGPLRRAVRIDPAQSLRPE
jgi:predicted permease